MPVATVLSRAQRGIEAPQVQVEVDIGAGLPTFNIVGLPEAAVKESKDRVRAALTNSDFKFPSGRITVNLAPADLPKEGGRFDLPIAIGVVSASGQLTDVRSELQACELYGELSLSGELRSMKGLLPAALAASVARHPVVVPRINAAEAALVKDCEVIAARHSLEVCAHFGGARRLGHYRAEPLSVVPTVLPDLCDVRGQLHARRALEIAASGQHSLLLIGSPGGGEEHAGTASARHPAADERCRSDGGGDFTLDCRPSAEAERVARAAISQSSSHRFGCGARRWRRPSAAGGDFPGS